MRFDLKTVADLIEEKSRVMDLGCGKGDLLAFLQKEKRVSGTGIELNEKKAIEAISRGLTVIHGDIIKETRDFPDGAFDYVILSQTLQQVYDPEKVIREMVRIGKKGIVSCAKTVEKTIRLSIRRFDNCINKIWRMEDF